MLKFLGGALGAGGVAVGWVGGSTYQNYVNELKNNKIKYEKELPGLPSNGTVSVGKFNLNHGPTSLQV